MTPLRSKALLRRRFAFWPVLKRCPAETRSCLAGVGLLRDLGGLPDLLDNPVALELVDDPLHVERDVLLARRDSEMGCLRAQILVLEQGHLDPRCALRVGAFADPLRGQCPCRVVLLPLLQALVHFAKQCFVLARPLAVVSPYRHAPSSWVDGSTVHQEGPLSTRPIRRLVCERGRAPVGSPLGPPQSSAADHPATLGRSRRSGDPAGSTEWGAARLPRSVS